MSSHQSEQGKSPVARLQDIVAEDLSLQQWMLERMQKLSSREARELSEALVHFVYQNGSGSSRAQQLLTHLITRDIVEAGTYIPATTH